MTVKEVISWTLAIGLILILMNFLVYDIVVIYNAIREFIRDRNDYYRHQKKLYKANDIAIGARNSCMHGRIIEVEDLDTKRKIRVRLIEESFHDITGKDISYAFDLEEE